MFSAPAAQVLLCFLRQQLVQIYRIGHAEILEGAEQLAVDSFWQANLSRNPVIEIAEDALAVHSFRGSGQTEQNLWLVVFQEFLISGCRRMVELVHDDVIVEIWRGLRRKVLAVKSLDGHEKMVDAVGAIASNKHVTKIGISQHSPEGVQALPEYFFSVGNEQQAARLTRILFLECLVIQRRNHRLACASCGNDKIAGIATDCAFRLQLIQNLLLIRVWTNLHIEDFVVVAVEILLCL